MPQTLDAQLRPKTANETDKTVEVIFSTGADVIRGLPEIGRYIERLEVTQSSIDVSRIIGGPVLNAHRRENLADVIGQVLNIRVESGQAIALLKITNETIWEGISAGTLRAVSAGYEVLSIEESEENGMPVRTATLWRPLEISFVPIGADAGARVRSLRNTDMPNNTPIPNPNVTTPVAQAATVTQLRSIANIAQLDDAWIDSQSDAGASLELARSAAFQELETRTSHPIRTETTQSAPRAIVTNDHDAPERILPLMGEALHARSNPSYNLSEPARQFAGLSMVEIGRECLIRRGISHRGMAAGEVVSRSLHTTSDFSIILGDTVGRSLRVAYESAPAGIKNLGTQTTARDFRKKHRVMLGEGPTLERTSEAGEFKYGTFQEAEETYKIDTFGRIVGISRQAIVNDDLSAFSDISTRMGIAASDFEHDHLTQILLQNDGSGPKMQNGKTLFHEDHGNLAAVGTTISDPALIEARIAMRTQKGLAGRPITIIPKTVLVPPELEVYAERNLAEVRATTIEHVNPFSALDLIVESRLAGRMGWYVVANNVDGLEYAYLEGAPGPQTESRNGFEVDGVEVKVHLDFGAGFIDHRGWFHNPYTLDS